MIERAKESYGQRKLTMVDRAGVWLSQRAIRRQLGQRRGIRILELGCGYWATQLVSLSDIISEGVGVDFRVAPELRAEPKLTLVESSIEEALPLFEKSSFDAVLLNSVLEHLTHPDAVLLAAHQLLRIGGVLLVNVPTWRGKTFLEFSAFRLGLSPKLEMDDHKMYYDKRDLWPKLISAGFAPSKTQLRYHKFGLNLFAWAIR